MEFKWSLNQSKIGLGRIGLALFMGLSFATAQANHPSYPDLNNWGHCQLDRGGFVESVHRDFHGGVSYSINVRRLQQECRGFQIEQIDAQLQSFHGATVALDVNGRRVGGAQQVGRWHNASNRFLLPRAELVDRLSSLVIVVWGDVRISDITLYGRRVHHAPPPNPYPPYPHPPGPPRPPSGGRLIELRAEGRGGTESGRWDEARQRAVDRAVQSAESMCYQRRGYPERMRVQGPTCQRLSNRKMNCRATAVLSCRIR